MTDLTEEEQLFIKRLRAVAKEDLASAKEIVNRIKESYKKISVTKRPRKAKYICIEGLEGVGKTTQCNLIANALREAGYQVLLTKEPGTPLLPVTMSLREVMLSGEYEPQLTKISREYISQAIRSIHLEKLIVPALQEYDFIIQDRGLLSGIAYATACGVDEEHFVALANLTLQNFAERNSLRTESPEATPSELRLQEAHTQLSLLYDMVIHIRTNDVSACLHRARSSKKEFAGGDAIEAKGISFFKTVEKVMRSKKWVEELGVIEVEVDMSQSKDEVLKRLMELIL